MSVRAVVTLGLVSVVIALAGCGDKRDFANICNAGELSGAASQTDASLRMEMMTSWIAANVHGEAAKSAMAALATAPPDERETMLKLAAHKASYDGPCPLVEE